MKNMNDIQDPCAHSWVLRVFNGPLQGSEFRLAQHRTLFLVGDQAQFCDQNRPLSVPADAIYIPLAHDGCNFEIIIVDNAITGVTLRVLDDEQTQDRSCPAQTLERVGGLRFAVRPADEAWDDALLMAGEAAPLLPRATFVPGELPKWRMAAAGIAAALLLAAGWYLARPNPVDDVQTLIGGSRSSFTVLRGTDKHVYVFADSEREASWGRQVLERSHKTPQASVVTYDQERQRLEKVIDRLEPSLAWHRIELSDPAKPKLVVSNERNLLTPSLQTRLAREVQKAMPYASDVSVIGSDDRQLARFAEQGLRLLAVPYTRLGDANGVTFTLEGSLQDAELRAVREYVNEFNRQWGGRYVHFAVELKDDWLKGKSFQYGPQGYVKMAPSSWYFPKPL